MFLCLKHIILKTGREAEPTGSFHVLVPLVAKGYLKKGALKDANDLPCNSLYQSSFATALRANEGKNKTTIQNRHLFWRFVSF